MPVTAKLSRRFYEKLGEEIANELVDWFNQVDATYRSDLRQLNDLNFERFSATLGQRFAQFDAGWERRFVELEAAWDKRLRELDAKWERRFTQLETKWDLRWRQLDAKIDQLALEAKMAKQNAAVTRWMFLFWIGTIVPLGGLIVGLMLALH